jgi:sulfate transport system substrate-binding protein
MRKLIASLVLSVSFVAGAHAQSNSLLNVSYDPTREFYRAYNVEFVKYWEQQSGQALTILQSHGGSGAQARAVIDGMKADVVTLASEGDIDAIAKATKKIPLNWRSLLPHRSTPYTSTIVFLVRKGNPKHLKDWDDLLRPGVRIVAPNPKTSGGAKWAYLAAWGYAAERFNGDEARMKEFVAGLYRNVPMLDAGARGASTTFARRGMGDVLLSWENEAFIAINELGQDKFDIVVPSVSIKAEPSVALVPGNTEGKGTTKAAQAYLEYLYSPVAQKLIAKNYYRAADPELADPQDLKRFPNIRFLTIDDPVFGGWNKVTPKHFAPDGIFDQIYR